MNILQNGGRLRLALLDLPKLGINFLIGEQCKYSRK